VDYVGWQVRNLVDGKQHHRLLFVVRIRAGLPACNRSEPGDVSQFARTHKSFRKWM